MEQEKRNESSRNGQSKFQANHLLVLDYIVNLSEESEPNDHLETIPALAFVHLNDFLGP